MNNVSCTIGFTVGIDASVGAVVLVMLSLEQSLIRSIVAVEKKSDPKGALFEEHFLGTSTLRIYNESKSGDRSYSTPGSSPNAEGLRPTIITVVDQPA